MAWPTSARPVLVLHADKNSPVDGPFVQPQDGVVMNHVNVNAPRGYGPNQINAVTRVAFQHIYSYGGTALRIETDGSLGAGGYPDRGASVDSLTATQIVGVDCNRAVSLSPHGQDNGAVKIAGVWAYSCNQAVVAQADTKLTHQGSFAHAVVSNVRVQSGDDAQLDSTTTLWTLGQSYMPYYIDPAAYWNPVIAVKARAGLFTRG